MDPDLRSQAKRHDDLLSRRLDNLIPMLMERSGIDAWVVAAREYNEDPVLSTMLPATWLATARRRTILVFLRQGEDTTRLAVSRYAVGDAFPAAWDPEEEPDQWRRLAALLEEADPERIGVNTSPVFALADGISSSELDTFVGSLPDHLQERVAPATDAAIGWLETRLPEEADTLARACSIAHQLLRRALSPEVIEPGRTTTAGVEWWLRDMTHAGGHRAWFHPTCSVQRAGVGPKVDFSTRPGDTVIQPGDLVHVDFGLVHQDLCTDQQQHAYVLLPGQSAPPPGLVEGLRRANRLQDLLMGEFVTGLTGNEILAATRRAAAKEGIDGLVYTHPIGVHGHAAGPTIGLWDRQDGVPGEGDYPLWPDTAYSIELQARVPVPEWDGQVVQIMLEEEAFFDGSSCRFVDGRQTELWLV